MRTSRPTICRRRGGFTFVEALVALAILTGLLLVVLPNMQRLLQGEREREFRRLATVIRMARHEAVLSRTPHRLRLDLATGEYLVERYVKDVRDRPGEFRPVEDIRALATHTLPESLELMDLVLYGESSERLTDRPVEVAFDATGFMDRFLLHVRDEDVVWTFRTSLLGRTDWQEGYLDDPLL